jgi:diketogulonate reductase-like aldo/keto reductase
MKAATLPANGANIPRIGLGTSRLRDETCIRSVNDALELGYRHIDTAHMYGNEVEVGRAIKGSGVARGDIFITTKVLPDNIGAGKLQDSGKQSLERLGLDHVDLLLIHWPNPRIKLSESIAALCDAKSQGLAKNIGVANFTIAMVEEAVHLAATHGEKLATNQCEYHPRLNQDRLLSTCRKHGIVLVSYCPVGQGNMLGDATVAAIARKIGRTPAQVVLRWHMQQDGVAAIPKSSSRAHLAENLDIFGFELSAEDMRNLSGLAVPNGRIVNPGFGPQWD